MWEDDDNNPYASPPLNEEVEGEEVTLACVRAAEDEEEAMRDEAEGEEVDTRVLLMLAAREERSAVLSSLVPAMEEGREWESWGEA